MNEKDKIALAIELAKLSVLQDILRTLRRQENRHAPLSDLQLKPADELVKEHLKQVDQLLGS